MIINNQNSINSKNSQDVLDFASSGGNSNTVDKNSADIDME